jgi:flagellar basal-body rod protein FlgF/flagellar basal-body rod protein FlgG
MVRLHGLRQDTPVITLAPCVLLLPRRKNLSSGFYAACAGLRAQSQALELIASDVANISTTGYRGQQPMFGSLLASAHGELPSPLNRAINDFGVLAGSRVDLSSGNLEKTGNPLDLAIEGKGFFAVQTGAGVLYTRNGNFQVSPHGQLTTSVGDLVLGEQGPITMPSGTASISTDGTISTNGAVAGKLRMVELAPGAAPLAVGNSYYSAPSKALRPAEDSSIRQNMLEGSNVNSVQAVVAMIAVQRHAEMLERAMATFETNLDHIAANDLPKI